MVEIEAPLEARLPQAPPAPNLPPAPPEAPHEGPIDWVELGRYADPLEAHIVAGRLEGEGVPTLALNPCGSFMAAFQSILWVPAHLLHRANWILCWEPPAEAELIFLATGELE